MQVVEGVLDGGVVAVVVLRVHDGERVTPGDRLRPGDRVGVGVVLGDGVVGLVEEREVHLGQVHQFDLERVGGLGGTLEPVGDGQADPSRPGAGHDDLEGGLGHGNSSVGWNVNSCIRNYSTRSSRVPDRPTRRLDHPGAGR